MHCTTYRDVARESLGVRLNPFSVFTYIAIYCIIYCHVMHLFFWHVPIILVFLVDVNQKEVAMKPM